MLTVTITLKKSVLVFVSVITGAAFVCMTFNNVFAALSCSITTAAACTSPSVVVYRMSTSTPVLFGKFNIGAILASDNLNELECATYTAPISGTIASLSQYHTTDGSNTATQWKGVILDYNTLAILTNGVSTAASVGANSWATTTFALPPTLVSGTVYALCTIFNGHQVWQSDNDADSIDVFDATGNSFTTPVNPTGGDLEIHPGQFISSTYATYVRASVGNHAELASQSTAAYANTVACCTTGGAELGNSCSGSFVAVLKLSATTNAHVEQNSQSNYAQSACLSNTTGTVSVGYQASNCTGFDTTVGSMSATTNAHVGNGSEYTTKICATSVASSLTFVVDSTSKAFPSLSPGTLVSASSSLEVKTTNATGFSISVNRDTSLATMALNTDSATTIPDKTAWSAPGATTTTGNSSASTTQPLTLQFRVRQANTDTPNYASTWWGTNDTTSNALFAGFPTSAQTIINRSVSAVASTTSIVLYNVNVPVTQKNGAYSGSLTYTTVANP